MHMKEIIKSKSSFYRQCIVGGEYNTARNAMMQTVYGRAFLVQILNRILRKLQINPPVETLSPLLLSSLDIQNSEYNTDEVRNNFDPSVAKERSLLESSYVIHKYSAHIYLQEM